MANRLSTLVSSLVEATATPYPIDRYLEFIDPMLTWRDTRAKVVDIQRQTDRSVTLTLTPTRQWRGHQSGQYVEVGVVINGTRHRRFYSPTTAESASGTLELTISAHEQGLVSRYLYSTLQLGEIVTLSAAAGTFSLPTPRPARIVLISGGSGITPVLSMLRTLVTEGHPGPITFVHYARTHDDVPHREDLEEIASAVPGVDVRLHYTRTAKPERFESAHVADVVVDADVFVCGPHALMQDVLAYADTEGFAGRVHTEAFSIASAPLVSADQQGGTLAFTSSATSTENDGRTILEQAESAGLTPEYGCRMGICFSCTKVRSSGTTRNVLTGDTDSEPDKHIQICVSAPCGDVEIDL